MKVLINKKKIVFNKTKRKKNRRSNNAYTCTFVCICDKYIRTTKFKNMYFNVMHPNIYK